MNLNISRQNAIKQASLPALLVPIAQALGADASPEYLQGVELMKALKARYNQQYHWLMKPWLQFIDFALLQDTKLYLRTAWGERQQKRSERLWQIFLQRELATLTTVAKELSGQHPELLELVKMIDQKDPYALFRLYIDWVDAYHTQEHIHLRNLQRSKVIKMFSRQIALNLGLEPANILKLDEWGLLQHIDLWDNLELHNLATKATLYHSDKIGYGAKPSRNTISSLPLDEQIRHWRANLDLYEQNQQFWARRLALLKGELALPEDIYRDTEIDLTSLALHLADFLKLVQQFRQEDLVQALLGDPEAALSLSGYSYLGLEKRIVLALKTITVLLQAALERPSHLLLFAVLDGMRVFNRIVIAVYQLKQS